MASARESLVAALEFVFDRSGWGWHEPLLAALQDLTPEQAAFAPPGRNSIWKIVLHVVFWKDYMADRMAGKPKLPLEQAVKVQWPPVPETTDSAWQATLQRLKDAQVTVQAELAKRTDDELGSPFVEHKDVSLYAIAHGLMAHDSYHCGQIRYLRALQRIPTKP